MSANQTAQKPQHTPILYEYGDIQMLTQANPNGVGSQDNRPCNHKTALK